MKRFLLATLMLGLSTTGFAGIRETIEYEKTVLHKKTDRFTDEVWFDKVTGDNFEFLCRGGVIEVRHADFMHALLRTFDFRFRVVDFPPSQMLTYDIGTSKLKLHPEHADLLIFQLLKADRNRSSYPDGITVLIELVHRDESRRSSFDLTGISESLPQLDCFGIMR